jgi:hypothetical protein
MKKHQHSLHTFLMPYRDHLCVVSKVRGNIMNEFQIGNLNFAFFYGCETWSSH